MAETYKTLRKANIAMQKHRDPENKITPLFSAVELGGEAGEVLNVVKKLERASLGLKGSNSNMQALADELADVIICADLLAMCYGIDVGPAVVKKFNENSEKVGIPVRLSGPMDR
jgi:NTP pyrophosphatase (non-canonical NTP hydrolase)